MTRKDYEAMAAIIRREVDFHAACAGQYREGREAATHSLTLEIADMLAVANPRFDRARFLAACGVSP